MRSSIVNFLSLTALVVTASCAHAPAKPNLDSQLLFPGEKNLKNIQQLTAGGTNAEAYWSPDGERFSFQRKVHGEESCDQIYTMRSDGTEMHRVSNGKGRTTCSFYFPDGKRILYSSTFGSSDQCPAAPDMSHGYVWPIYDTYQFYSTKPDGTDTLPLEPGAPRAYNAEMTVCHDGTLVFTSDRDGDLDLYTAKLDPMGTISGIRKITNTLGYDGGATFSKDCKQLVWRASRPKPGKETDEYKALLKKHLVRPTQLEIWVGNVDGTHAHQVTRIHAASFAPEFTPDGTHVVFASNPRDPRGRSFDLYKINVNGTGLERVTFSNTFESFPMFSPDRKKIAFSSNRNAKAPHETNVFTADWVNTPDPVASLESTDAAERFHALVEQLSAPEMEGRGVGTPGLAKAIEIVSAQFKKIGLKPFYDVVTTAKGGKGYLQRVDFKPTGKEAAPQSENIIGMWGDQCGKMPPVLIGAHVDHLGHGAENSLEPTKKGIHPGADDNASGVAGVLEAARIITLHRELAKSSCFMFAAFTGEEIGIVGSSQMVEMLKAAHRMPKAMLNLDMVGRMENNVLTIFGTDSAKEFHKMVEDECGSRALTCPGGGDGYGPSDHMAFYIGKVPVLHFFTGPHVDYHRTSDVASKVNATGGVQAAEVVAAIAIRAMSPKTHLHYEKAKQSKDHTLFGRKRASNGVYLGTIPDYSSLSSPHGPSGGGLPGGGIGLAGARPGSPADQAGVKEKDILVSIDEKPIASLQDFMAILAELKPGQKIVMGIKRDGKLLKLPATVGKRE